MDCMIFLGIVVVWANPAEKNVNLVVLNILIDSEVFVLVKSLEYDMNSAKKAQS